MINKYREKKTTTSAHEGFWAQYIVSTVARLTI